MKTALKVIAIVFTLLVLGIIGIVIFALSMVDQGAKMVVEQGGTYAMGVETTVDTMDLTLSKGAVEMGGLNIANPEGFSTENFFSLANADAKIDLESVGTDTVLIPSVSLIGIDVTLDKGQDPSNYNQILENLARFESGESAPADKSKAGKNVIIKSLVLENINIHVANMPGVSLVAGDVAINIPRIELLDIGEKESMNAGDIFNLVIKTVLSAAVEAGGGIIPGDVLGELGNGLAGLSSLGDLGIGVISDLDLDNVMGQVGEQIDQAAGDIQKAVDDVAGDLGKDVGDGIDDAVDGAADKIKGIFGGKKDKP